MVSRKYNPRKRKKLKRPRHIWANIVLLAGVIIALTGFLLAFIICVDRVSEFLNGKGYQNNWNPVQGNIFDVIRDIPALLYICLFKFMEASFATLLFFPLVVLIVPLTDMFFWGDFTILLYGYAPLFIGFALALWAIVAGEDKTPPKNNS